MKIPCRDDALLKLQLEDVKWLSNQIAEKYKKFVQDAPPAWLEDGFLQSHFPSSITSRYGQNQCICVSGQLDNEGRMWDQERDYSQIDYMTFAIATDIR